MEVLRGYVIDGRPDRSGGISEGRKCRPSHAARTGGHRCQGVAGAGRDRRRAARDRRQAAKAHSGRTAPPHQEYAGDSERHRLAEPAHGRHAIESRLLALGRAHDLLLQARWSSADLAHIVHGATEPYDGEGEGKFSIQGPDLKIVSGAVIALAMTLNELCTNATKFGALSWPTGRIEIAWTIDPNN